MNTGDLSLKRKQISQNKKLEGKPNKKVKVELPKINVDDVENSQGNTKVKKKTKMTKKCGTKSIKIVQQKLKVSVKSEQCLSKTNESESKRSKGKKKSKREKRGLKSSNIGEKPNVSVKSEKCSKISKSNLVKSENKPISSERKQGGNIRRLEGKLKVKQEKV